MKLDEQANLSHKYRANLDKKKVNSKKKIIEPYALDLHIKPDTVLFFATKRKRRNKYFELKKDYPNLKMI